MAVQFYEKIKQLRQAVTNSLHTANKLLRILLTNVDRKPSYSESSEPVLTYLSSAFALNMMLGRR